MKTQLPSHRLSSDTPRPTPLVRAGSFTDLRMADNWITTIQGVHFDETGGGNSSAQYRLFEKVPNASGASCDLGPISYATGTNLMVGVNYVSSYAHDFDGLTGVTTAHTNSTVTAGASNSVQVARTVLQDPLLTFRPAGFGRVTRVLPVVSTNNRTYVWKTGASTSVTNTIADPVLYKSIELSMDEPTIGSTNVSLPVRLVWQTTPNSGLATEWGDSQLLWLTASGLVSGTQFYISEAEGVVNAISPGLELYGHVSDAGGSNPQAWRWRNASNYGHPFSDKAYTYGYSTNWVLQVIVDVTPDGLLIGNGTKGGSTKAFLIVRQPSAN